MSDHKQRTIMVPIDVDEGIANLVLYLNTIPGVRTHASCQGTLGEGGEHPYRPQVMVTWANDEAFRRLCREFDVSEVSASWCYIHPREKMVIPGRRFLDEFYYWTALLMPLWWRWQWQYVANARVYFEMKN